MCYLNAVDIEGAGGQIFQKNCLKACIKDVHRGVALFSYLCTVDCEVAGAVDGDHDVGDGDQDVHHRAPGRVDV